MLKYSRQRDAILRNLRDRYDHPNADMVFESIREEIPNISLGTVYRNLALLVDTGDILKVGHDSNGKERYDGHTHPHAHFFCESCGAIEDVREFLDTHPIEKLLQIKINEANITLKGTCRVCLEKENL